MLNPADEGFLSQLKTCLPEAAFRPLEPHHLEDPRGRFSIQEGFVVAPGSTQEVATLLRACRAAQIGVVPFGGGTGLVGAQIPQGQPACVILSLARMAKIREVRLEEKLITAEAGVTLQKIHDTANEIGALFPLWIGSVGTCQIGGNLATNAGGINVLRYGNARDQVLSLEAVMPSGEIWHGLRRLKKDNTGYDLRHLLIGAEGTLGVITAATMRLVAPPKAEATALLHIKNPSAALRLLDFAHSHWGNVVSACELIGRTSLDLLSEAFPDLPLPFAERPAWCVLIDIGFMSHTNPTEKLSALFEWAQKEGLSEDGIISHSEQQRRNIWKIREQIPQANRKTGAIVSTDISVPLSEIGPFTAEVVKRINKIAPLRVNCFGHVGDGNLHCNIFAQKGQKASAFDHQRAEIREAVLDLACRLGGSISAEHGIGREKITAYEKFGDPAKLAAMRAIKAALDPGGIMNPGALFVQTP